MCLRFGFCVIRPRTRARPRPCRVSAERGSRALPLHAPEPGGLSAVGRAADQQAPHRALSAKHRLARLGRDIRERALELPARRRALGRVIPDGRWVAHRGGRGRETLLARRFGGLLQVVQGSLLPLRVVVGIVRGRRRVRRVREL